MQGFMRLCMALVLASVIASLVGCIVPDGKQTKASEDGPSLKQPAVSFEDSVEGGWEPVDQPGMSYAHEWCNELAGEWVCQALPTGQNFPYACPNLKYNHLQIMGGGFRVEDGKFMLAGIEQTVIYNNGQLSLSPSGFVWGAEMLDTSFGSMVLTYAPGCSVLLERSL